MSLSSENRQVVTRLLRRQASSRVADAAFEQALDSLVDAWTDGFLDILSETKLAERDVSDALSVSGLSAESVNEVVSPDKTAGLGDWISAFGGKILKGTWHMLVHPFISAWKLVTSSSYRGKIKTAFKRAVKHEIRASKHMVKVALRLAAREKVPPQEIKAAALQFVDIASKVILGVIVGPHVAHLFAAGPLQALLALMSPIDEIAGIMLDKPIRWASQKFLGGAIGLLPSGFYTHFA